MKKDKWDNKLIDSYINNINQMILNEEDEEKLDYYFSDLRGLDAAKNFEIDSNYFKQDTDFRLNCKQNILSLSLFEDFFIDIQEFNRNRSLVSNFKLENLENFGISFDSLLTFVFDFYQQLDSSYIQILNKLYASYKDNIIFTNKRSCTISLFTDHITFINIEQNQNIQEYISCIHEFGHVISDYIKMRGYSETKYPFFEVLPLFSEAHALDYLSRIFPVFKDDISKYKRAVILNMLNLTKLLLHQNDFYSSIQCNNRISAIINLMLKKEVNIIDANKVIGGSVYENYIYLISFLVVIELLYMDDIELAKDKLNKILLIDNIENYSLFLKENGINLNQHSSEYVRCFGSKKIITN